MEIKVGDKVYTDKTVGIYDVTFWGYSGVVQEIYTTREGLEMAIIKREDGSNFWSELSNLIKDPSQ